MSGSKLQHRPDRRLHQVEIDPTDKKIQEDPSGIRRKLNGYDYLPGSQTADVYRTSGCYGKAQYQEGRKGEIVKLNVSFKEGEIRTKVLEIVKSLKGDGFPDRCEDHRFRRYGTWQAGGF